MKNSTTDLLRNNVISVAWKNLQSDTTAYVLKKFLQLFRIVSNFMTINLFNDITHM